MVDIDYDNTTLSLVGPWYHESGVVLDLSIPDICPLSYIVFMVCEQQRQRPACASSQTDQRLCYSLFVKDDYLTLLQVKFQFSS